MPDFFAHVAPSLAHAMAAVFGPMSDQQIAALLSGLLLIAGIVCIAALIRRTLRCTGQIRSATAIQISGTFGSRQEEAQRLGRILRPKADGRTAYFYSIVSRDTNDQTFAANRQRFLAEQGYAYEIVDAEAIVGQHRPD